MSDIIGIGTEIIECLRIARMIERYGEQFINRVYTDEEIGFCRSRKQATQHFAAHWAAKEAILRALGARWGPGINWRDIEVRSQGGGRLTVAVRGAVGDLVQQLGVAKLLVTVSHCRTHAVAYAIAEGRAPPSGEA
jgi:holo-[acyl-carrier protein] synthase